MALHFTFEIGSRHHVVMDQADISRCSATKYSISKISLHTQIAMIKYNLIYTASTSYDTHQSRDLSSSLISTTHSDDGLPPIDPFSPPPPSPQLSQLPSPLFANTPLFSDHDHDHNEDDSGVSAYDGEYEDGGRDEAVYQWSQATCSSASSSPSSSSPSYVDLTLGLHLDLAQDLPHQGVDAPLALDRTKLEDTCVEVVQETVVCVVEVDDTTLSTPRISRRRRTTLSDVEQYRRYAMWKSAHDAAVDRCTSSEVDKKVIEAAGSRSMVSANNSSGMLPPPKLDSSVFTSWDETDAVASQSPDNNGASSDAPGYPTMQDSPPSPQLQTPTQSHVLLDDSFGCPANEGPSLSKCVSAEGVGLGLFQSSDDAGDLWREAELVSVPASGQ